MSARESTAVLKAKHMHCAACTVACVHCIQSTSQSTADSFIFLEIYNGGTENADLSHYALV